MPDLSVKLAAASPWSKHEDQTAGRALPPNVDARRYDYRALRALYAESQLRRRAAARDGLSGGRHDHLGSDGDGQSRDRHADDGADGRDYGRRERSVVAPGDVAGLAAGDHAAARRRPPCASGWAAMPGAGWRRTPPWTAGRPALAEALRETATREGARRKWCEGSRKFHVRPAPPLNWHGLCSRTY